jgi:outer membrane protein OmpA-like peptidoglycan-associated protein
MSFALPLVLGILRKHVSTSGLNPSGLASLLFSQRGALERTGLDNRITSALGFGDLSSFLSTVPAPGEPSAPHVTPTHRRESDRGRPWLPWAIAAGVGALALMLFFNRPDDGGAIERSAQATSSAESARVYFGSGETTIDGGDRVKIASVAETAKRDNRPVTITGYTDRTGDPTQNEEIAKDRAAAVRDALVAEGVNESNIVMDPPAEVTGAGTNDEARRVDIAMR